MSSDVALMLIVTCVGALFVLWTWERVVAATRVRRMFPPRTKQSAKKSKLPERLGEVQIAAVCAEVAARLRAGDATWEAWQKTLARTTGTSPERGLDVEKLLQRSGEAGAIVLVSLRFGEQTGAPLATIMERTSYALTERQRAQDALEVAFAGPKMSARVLSALPLVGLIGGELLGAHPIEWFMGGPTHVSLAAAGIGLAVAGNMVSRGLIARAMTVGVGKRRAPVLCDLAVSALQSGMAIPSVLSAIGLSMDDGLYCQIGRELELGATWAEAWEQTPESGELLGGALEPAWRDGVSPTTLLLGVAEQARSQAVGDSKKAAERLGVKLAFPLGLLLLPSFVILGLMPVFFSLVGGELGGIYG